MVYLAKRIFIKPLKSSYFPVQLLFMSFKVTLTITVNVLQHLMQVYLIHRCEYDFHGMSKQPKRV